MNVRAIWLFIAGDSRCAPFAVAAAVGLTLLLLRVAPGGGAWIGALFVAVIAAGLVAAVFERT
jgi:hypothetical protein